MKEKLTKEERKYIVNELLTTLGSVQYGGMNLDLKEIDKWEKKHEFNISFKEFKTIISIIKKLHFAEDKQGEVK